MTLANEPSMTNTRPLNERLGEFRERIQTLDLALQQRFIDDGIAISQRQGQHNAVSGKKMDALLQARSDFVDDILLEAWPHFLGDTQNLHALVAVGGYGRRELNLHSDIDILVLLGPGDENSRDALGQFFCFLWDIGLKPGHSVRSVAECILAASADQTIITNLLEGRLLAGASSAWEALKLGTRPENIWASADFFQAKLREQQARYAKLHNTAFNLEPNIKEGPGGLRDIQLIGWILRRHYNSPDLAELVAQGWLTPEEHQELCEGRTFLQTVRFALHQIAGRCEDRLLFEYQRDIAQMFGYGRADLNTERLGTNAVIEEFMQHYFRTVTGLERMNDLLLQLFNDAVLTGTSHHTPQALSPLFQTVNHYLEVRHPAVFRNHPLALLEIFLVLQQHPDCKGIRASTIRLIRQHLYLIDDTYRNNPLACDLFMEILRQPAGITHQFRIMNRYGLLAAWIPEFGQVVGRMQYDLFHVYTVDEHTLFVIRNLRRFSLEEFRPETPQCHEVFQRVNKPELLYIAGLLHDIGKGSGGDHSTIGAEIAARFCERHRIGSRDSLRVQWLVRNHLLMSLTAQRKDISDPDVIHEFASSVGDQSTLNHLYLLTVADIRATNPNLWNSWKSALLQQLYTSTSWALRRGLHTPLDQSASVNSIKEEASGLLGKLGLPLPQAQPIWSMLGDEYFLRFLPEEIAWHTLIIALTPQEGLPLVLLRPISQRGSAEILIYQPNQVGLFARSTATLDQLGLSVMDAKIITDRMQHVMLSFNVLEENGASLRDPFRQAQICDRLRQDLVNTTGDGARIAPVVYRRETRQIRHFAIPTQVFFYDDPQQRHTILELIATDRPGLLSKVGQAFMEQGIQLYNAKVSTLGSQAEDIFYITDEQDQPILDSHKRQSLASAIINRVGTC